jgi:hypothetical protein
MKLLAAILVLSLPSLAAAQCGCTNGSCGQQSRAAYYQMPQNFSGCNGSQAQYYAPQYYAPPQQYYAPPQYSNPAPYYLPPNFAAPGGSCPGGNCRPERGLSIGLGIRRGY